MTQEVVVPLPLAERLLEHLSNLQDEGPIGEGWKSDELTADIASLVEAVNAAKDASGRPKGKKR